MKNLKVTHMRREIQNQVNNINFDFQAIEESLF